MWSPRVDSRKVVMTDSSERQAAALSGTEETKTSVSTPRAVGEPAVENSGVSPPIHSNSVATTPNYIRKSSVTRSIEPVHQSSPESGTNITAGERHPGEGVVSTSESTTHTNSVSSQNVVADEPTEVITSRPGASSQISSSTSTASTNNTAVTSDRLTQPPTLTTSTSTSTETEPTTMSGNSDYHSSTRSSAASSSSTSSSARRQRNGLFGINLDLNFDPSSWLVPSNVAGRSISSLSVLPDWVRHPVSIIPNRTSDSPTSQSSSGLSEGRRSQHDHHAGGAASRLVSHHHHHHPSQVGGSGAAGSSWNSASFQTSNSIPSNMHHHHHHHQHHSSVPLRTRHTVVNSMRSVDEDLDADYNPVSTIDIGAAGRDHRDDTHSYVIDMDSPMGGWAEEDGPTTSTQVLRGASTGEGVSLSNISAAAEGNMGTPGGDGGGGSRRSLSDINLSPGGGPGGAAAGAPGVGADGNAPSMTDAATGANERTRAAEILRDAPETRAFINEISRYTTIRPFIVINFLKGVFDHGTSILAFLALVVTFSHANSMVKKEVSKQRKRNLLYLTMIVVNLMACVAFIYYIFCEMELYYALVFLPTRSDLSAFWSLMWAVGVTDYVAKFGTVFVKIIVVSLPGCILPFQKRGKFYLFIEYTSQLYRSFLPVYPWLFYLVSAYEGTARMFGLLLAGIYVIFKITDSVKRFKDWLKALEKLLSNVHYGTNPTPKQLDGAGTICPICHDNFANPTRLQCSHIFCEECVATWFDRERTCPMCRAKVVDDPTYRDGSTSQYIQLF